MHSAPRDPLDPPCHSPPPAGMTPIHFLCSPRGDMNFGENDIFAICAKKVVDMIGEVCRVGV